MNYYEIDLVHIAGHVIHNVRSPTTVRSKLGLQRHHRLTIRRDLDRLDMKRHGFRNKKPSSLSPSASCTPRSRIASMFICSSVVFGLTTMVLLAYSAVFYLTLDDEFFTATPIAISPSPASPSNGKLQNGLYFDMYEKRSSSTTQSRLTKLFTAGLARFVPFAF